MSYLKHVTCEGNSTKFCCIKNKTWCYCYYYS